MKMSLNALQKAHSLMSTSTRIMEGVELGPFVIFNGVLIMADAYSIKTISVLERNGSEIKALYHSFWWFP